MNKRYLLRAYEQADPVRTAAIVVDLFETQPTVAITRAAVAAEWARRYPRHTEITGKRSIRKRITTSLSWLRLARAVTTDGEHIVPGPDWEALRTIAGNLTIVVDKSGIALPPREWATQPLVPSDLVEVQHERIRKSGSP